MTSGTVERPMGRIEEVVQLHRVQPQAVIGPEAYIVCSTSSGEAPSPIRGWILRPGIHTSGETGRWQSESCQEAGSGSRIARRAVGCRRSSLEGLTSLDLSPRGLPCATS